MYVELTNIKKKINGVPILSNISIHMDGGKIYGLRGRNGAGKTMLMRAICGLVTIDSGSIDINGQVLSHDKSFPPSVGALIENPGFIPDLTGYNNLKLVASIQKKINEEQIKDALLSVGLDPADKRKYRKYSLGMKQKLGIACACMELPDLLILDEPINALDEEGVRCTKQLLQQAKERGSVIIVACHDREELDYLADEIILLEEGGKYVGKELPKKNTDIL